MHCAGNTSTGVQATVPGIPTTYALPTGSVHGTGGGLPARAFGVLTMLAVTHETKPILSTGDRGCGLVMSDDDAKDLREATLAVTPGEVSVSSASSV